MTKTPAKIAAGLTEAQRRAVIDGKWNIYPIVYQLVGIGLVEKSHGEASTLTPLGEAVREHLEKK